MNTEPTSWHSYPRIYNLGHRALEPIVGMSLIVEEKIDGSQFSFGRFNGELKVKSKNVEMIPDNPCGMFQAAVDAVSKLDLTEGWTYRGEYLSKPKHNTLKYERVPKSHVVLFDINDAHESYLSPEAKRIEAERIGMECVPVFYHGVITTEKLAELLNTESILGGTNVEGVVLKQYELYGPDKKVIMAKYVSEMFKERHQGDWKERNPMGVDVITGIIEQLRTEPRWDKAIQHLRDNGELENSPRDIGKLLKEVTVDIQKEQTEWIKDQLFKWAWAKISRSVTQGFPEYYKSKIANEQIEVNE